MIQHGNVGQPVELDGRGGKAVVPTARFQHLDVRQTRQYPILHVLVLVSHCEVAHVAAFVPSLSERFQDGEPS